MDLIYTSSLVLSRLLVFAWKEQLSCMAAFMGQCDRQTDCIRQKITGYVFARHLLRAVCVVSVALLYHGKLGL